MRVLISQVLISGDHGELTTSYFAYMIMPMTTFRFTSVQSAPLCALANFEIYSIPRLVIYQFPHVLHRGRTLVVLHLFPESVRANL